MRDAAVASKKGIYNAKQKKKGIALLFIQLSSKGKTTNQ